MYSKVSGSLPKFGRNKFTPSRLTTEGIQQSGYIKREPVNNVKGQRHDKCHNCGNWLKPNHRNTIFNNCIGRGHFAKHCKKATVNQVDESEFTQNDINVLKNRGNEKTEEEFGVFAMRTVWHKSCRESRKSEFQIDCASPMSFV